MHGKSSETLQRIYQCCALADLSLLHWRVLELRVAPRRTKAGMSSLRMRAMAFGMTLTKSLGPKSPIRGSLGSLSVRYRCSCSDSWRRWGPPCRRPVQRWQRRRGGCGAWGPSRSQATRPPGSRRWGPGWPGPTSATFRARTRRTRRTRQTRRWHARCLLEPCGAAWCHWPWWQPCSPAKGAGQSGARRGRHGLGTA